MRTRNKRVLAILLSVIITIGILPATVIVFGINGQFPDDVKYEEDFAEMQDHIEFTSGAAVQLYQTRASEDDLTLGMYNSGANFSVTANNQMLVKYTPTKEGETETLRIILPPFFTTSNFNDTSSYKVVKGTMPLPAEYYDDADVYCAKLMGYDLQTEYLDFIFYPESTSQLSLVFSVFIQDYTDISSMMVNYGADPDKIPLYTIAQAIDKNDTVFSDRVLEADSRIEELSTLEYRKTYVRSKLDDTS